MTGREGYSAVSWSLRTGWLPALWALYFFLVNTIAYEPALTRAIIWSGGAVVGLATVAKCKAAVLRVGAEVWFLLGFLVWAALGVLLLVGTSPSDVTVRYFRLVLQFAAIIALLRTVMRRTGGMNWFWASFVLVVVYHVIMQPAEVSDNPLADLITPTRMAAVGAGENTLGWYGFMGALGAMVLLGEIRKIWPRVVLVIGGLFGVFAVVASASRGGFVALVMATVLWPLMCLRVRVRQTASFVVAVLVIGAAGYLFVERLYSGSYLSARMGDTESEREREGSRLNLLQVAVDLTVRNPVLGVGFGEFAVASGTGAYAHSDGAEVAASTGLVGFLLYFSIYRVLWKRLAWHYGRVSNPMLLYQANCARMVLLILFVSGLFFKPHFSVISSMFLFALTTGTADWLDRVCSVHSATALNRPRLGRVLSERVTGCLARSVPASPVHTLRRVVSVPGRGNH
ncbi:MAG: O-antigen ligase family protein [Thermoanaerobaculaceae bacterium]